MPPFNRKKRKNEVSLLLRMGEDKGGCLKKGRPTANKKSNSAFLIFSFSPSVPPFFSPPLLFPQGVAKQASSSPFLFFPRRLFLEQKRKKTKKRGHSSNKCVQWKKLQWKGRHERHTANDFKQLRRKSTKKPVSRFPRIVSQHPSHARDSQFIFIK